MSNVRVQHVYVDVTGEFDDDAAAGILLEWRREETVHGPRWQGLVIYADTYSTGMGADWTVRQEWVDAAHIRAVDAD